MKTRDGIEMIDGMTVYAVTNANEHNDMAVISGRIELDCSAGWAVTWKNGARNFDATRGFADPDFAQRLADIHNAEAYRLRAAYHAPAARIERDNAYARRLKRADARAIKCEWLMSPAEYCGTDPRPEISAVEAICS
jgi:hypothetical protein